MDSLDIYYRAFKDYRKETQQSSLCEKDRRAIAGANTEQDRLQSTKYVVTIEEDWIKAIEDGLKFVEQALGEQRQFIKAEGEVVPIEKIRKISKDTVVHLAKHSDMITHLPEDEESTTIVPDQLFMVEKLSDYAVYENRFLYMMMTYIKTFIEYRLGKIDELRHSYTGDFNINKKITVKKRSIKYDIQIFEERTDNPYPIPDEKCEKLIKRMSDCRDIIGAMLNTEIMVQVAKSPMIKPPIVKTNVLKMNNNFKNALALYDYIATYKGDGFTAEEVNFNFAPYSEELADEIAEGANLISFLAYKAGNKLDSTLELGYEEEEIKRKKQEEKKIAERLKRLKKRASESGKSLEEYMVVLEERNGQLEKDSEDLYNIKLQMQELLRQLEDMLAQKDELYRRIDELNHIIELKEDEINELKQKYIEDMATIKREHEAQVKSLTEGAEAQLETMKAECADRLNATIGEYESRVGELSAQLMQINDQIAYANAECDRRIAEMKFQMTDYENEKQRLEAALEARMNEERMRCAQQVQAAETKSQEEINKFMGEFDAMKKQVDFTKAELDGIRAQQGKLTPTIEYTSRERFKELEDEYEAFQQFFKKQWDMTKKEIRRTILWGKGEVKPQ